MLLNNFLLLISGLLFSSEFIFTKLFQVSSGKSYKATVKFIFFSGIIMFFILFSINGFKINFSFFSFICAFILAVLYIIANILSIKAFSIGSLVVLTLFNMSGGTVIPFLFGIIFLKEKVNIAYIIALFLLIFALFLPLLKKNHVEKKKFSFLFIIFCILIFILNGANATISKIHQINPNRVDTLDLLTIKYIVRTIVGLIMILTIPKQERFKGFFEKKSILWSAGYAFVHAFATVILLYCAVTENATLIYPLVTGGTLVFTPILALIVFKEKIDLCTFFQIIVSVIATVLFIL